MLTVLLLTISNIFMTFAWYGHLKFKESPLWIEANHQRSCPVQEVTPIHRSLSGETVFLQLVTKGKGT